MFALLLVLFEAGISETHGQEKEKELTAKIRAEFARNKGIFALAFKDAGTGHEILINERESFHAASTMKTPVMIEVFTQAAAGRFRLSDSILIKNEFRSIVDGSSYALSQQDDSEYGLYKILGQKLPISDVMYQMIIASSNLATNLIIEWVDARNVTKTMRSLGAMDIQVLRGVEDSKAFAKGLNNSVTAFDLMIIYDQMAQGKIIDGRTSEEMISILRDQKFNEIIPAQLPVGVTVAHKTGWINGVQHDSGIVMLANGKRYTLVLLSRNLEDEKAAVKSMANVSKMIYDYVQSGN